VGESALGQRRVHGRSDRPRIFTAVTNTLFVLAAGYYYTWRVSQRMLEEMKAQRTSMDRPQTIVQEDYDGPPEIDTAIGTPARGDEGHHLRVLGAGGEP
jgi:hypothetical protein